MCMHVAGAHSAQNMAAGSAYANMCLTAMQLQLLPLELTPSLDSLNILIRLGSLTPFFLSLVGPSI